MKRTIDEARFRDLVRLLDHLCGQHEELCGLVQGKIDAIKRADVDAMRLADVKERATAERIMEREGLRRSMMDGIGKELGLSSSHARALSLSQLAQRVAGTQRQLLERAGIALRDAVGRLARLNRVAGQVSVSILQHIESVFSAVTVQDDTGDYTGSGRVRTGTGNLLFDAVG